MSWLVGFMKPPLVILSHMETKHHWISQYKWYMFHISETFEKIFWIVMFLFSFSTLIHLPKPNAQLREPSITVQIWEIPNGEKLSLLTSESPKNKKNFWDVSNLIWQIPSRRDLLFCFIKRSCSPVRRNNRCPSVASTKPSGPQDLAVRFLTLNFWDSLEINQW